MRRSMLARNVLLIVALSLIFFLINRYLLLVSVIIILVYLNHQNHKRKRHEDLAVLNQDSH